MTKETLTDKKYSEGSFLFTVLIILIFIYFLISSETTIETPTVLTNQESKQVTKTPKLISAIFSPSVLIWELDILQWSIEWDLDPNLIATIMQIESCGDPSVVSNAGAIGLFQVMPFHFEEKENPFDVETNSYRGLGYLKKASQEYDSLKLTIASYNGGIYGASQNEIDWPEETKRYVYWGLNIYYDSISPDPDKIVLNEWLSNGGNRLCDNAIEELNQ